VDAAGSIVERPGRPRQRSVGSRVLRLGLVVVVGAVLSLVPPARATDAGEPAPGKRIPADLCRGLWIVPLAFGEGGPERTLRLVLDTGASETSVDPDAVQRVFGKRVRPGKKITLRDGTAGPMTVHRVRARTHDMDHLARALGTPIDGILGFPAFEDFLLTLDYPGREVRVGRGALPEVDGERVFRDVGTLRPYLMLEPGREPVPVLIDSGSTGALTLRESDVVSWAAEPRATGAVVRYRGIRIERTGRLDRDLTLGPLVALDPVTKLTADGTRLLGHDLMQRFSWTFDTRNRRIRMVPDGDAPIVMPPEWGIGVAFRPVDDGFAVARAFEDLPGARAGLRDGDVVVAVDGVPVHERGCRSLVDDGSPDPVVLTVRRDDRETTVEVVPQRIVP
jgi:hypothetical protein